LKERLFQILLSVMVAGLILSSFLTGVSALQTSDTNKTLADANSEWTLRIEINVNNTVSLSLDDLRAMPKTIVYAELSCYGQLLVSGQWGGVRLGVLLEKAGFSGQTADLEFYASDGYKIPFSISDATPQDVIIAYELDNQPLTEALRLVIPGANGDSWISMITEISINNPIYPHSPNPQAASIMLNPQTTQLLPLSQPSPTPQIGDQLTTQPTVEPPTNQSVQQQDSSSSSSQIEYGFPIMSGIIVAAATAITVSIGYFFYKRGK